jgi:hypothetical protein
MAKFIDRDTRRCRLNRHRAGERLISHFGDTLGRVVEQGLRSHFVPPLGPPFAVVR